MSGRPKAVADIGDAAKIPLPVDISISAEGDLLWVDTWNDGTVHLFDIRDPHAPKQIFEQKIGEQLNMVSESWDGKRVYFTSSLLANWDKTAPAGPDLQYFKLYDWDGKTLEARIHASTSSPKNSVPRTRCASARIRCTAKHRRREC